MARFPVYPAAFGAAFVLTRYLATSELFPVLGRPLLVVMILAIALQVVASIVTRNRHQGAFVATLVAALITDPAVGMLVLLAATGPLLVNIARTRRIGRIAWPSVTAFLTFVGAITLGLNGVSTVARINATLEAGFLDQGAPNGLAPADAPDIYLIMLDGYPRADTLTRDLGFDEGPFLRSMESAGFEVADRSHSNYNATLLTLTSVLNMQQVNAVIPVPPERRLHGAALVKHINGGAAIGALHDAGYEVVTIPSGITGTSIVSADRYLDSGQINSFEAGVLKAGLLPYLLPGSQRTWLFQQQSDRVHATFERLVDLAATSQRLPRFVYAHVMSPHAPIIFTADGGLRTPPECLPVSCTLWDEHRGPDEDRAVVDQIAYLNDQVLETVQRMIAASERRAVIVVFSDHGSRHDLADRDEMLRNLFLSHTPDHPGLFPRDVTLVNLIPRILNAYVGAGLPLSSEESYEIDLAAIGTTGYFPLELWPINR